MIEIWSLDDRYGVSTTWLSYQRVRHLPSPNPLCSNGMYGTACHGQSYSRLITLCGSSCYGGLRWIMIPRKDRISGNTRNCRWSDTRYHLVNIQTILLVSHHDRCLPLCRSGRTGELTKSRKEKENTIQSVRRNC
jgi:hypothetical protein